jgi:hypothetical protein
MPAPTSSLVLTNLAAELTAYYQEHRDLIHNELEIGLFEGNFSLQRNFTSIPGIVDEMVLTEVTIDDFIHQHVPTNATTFNPTADVINPQARVLKMRDYEGDLQFQDKIIERTHLMYLGQMKMLQKSNSPDKEKTFVEYLFWDHIIVKAKRTLRKAIFQATFANTTGYNWNKILDGWEKLIADAVTDTLITLVPTTGVTVSNVITKVEDVFDTLDTAVKTADDLVCALHSDIYKLWIRANRSTLGRSDQFNSQAILTLDGYSNCRVIEEPDFTTTKVAIYRASNPVVSTNNGEGTWEFQRQDRITKMMLNGSVGLQLTSVNTGKNNIAIGQ